MTLNTPDPPIKFPLTLASPALLRRDDCVLVVVDAQESLMNVMASRDALAENLTRLCHAARLLGIPTLATTQNRARLGAIVAPVQEALATDTPSFDKMAFSAFRSADFRAAIEAIGRRQVLLCGVETHICVMQTACGLAQEGFHVHVAPDAVSSRTVERHKLGMERLRDFDILPCATESAIFEWLETADDPRFRELLKLVK